MLFMRCFLTAVFAIILSPVVLGLSDIEKTEWRVEITPEGATIPHHIDRLRFEKGGFVSIIFERKGFASSPYTLSEKGGGLIVWDAKQKSETEGALNWHGELQGNVLKGTLTWSQPDGTVVAHSLSGSLVEPEADEGKKADKKTTASGSTPASPAKSKKTFGCSLNL